MIDTLEQAEGIVARQADFARAVTDKTDWRGYLDSGALGVSMPAELGGQAETFSTLVATFEGLALGGADAGILFAMAAQILSVQHAILRFGSEDQKRRYLPPLIRGEQRAAHAATEAAAGSDIFAMETAARRVAGGYRLSGTKRFITSAPDADFALVFARTDGESRQWGLSAFLVALDAAGVERGESVEKMGLEAVRFGELGFEDCFVAESQRLGNEGDGTAVFNASLDLERCFIMAPAVGVMRRELEAAVEHANHRRQRGRTLGSFQSVSNRLADMAVRLEISRLLLYHAAELKDRGRSTRRLSIVAKLVTSEAAFASSLDAVRNKGAQGFLAADSSAVSLRAAIGGLIYSGTSDVLRNMLAAQLGVEDV